MRAFVPFLGTPVVVVDDDGRRSELAAATMEHLGYTNVSVLKGGTNRWATDDQPTEWGVNVPSKDFGEKMLLQGHVPEIDAGRAACLAGGGETVHPRRLPHAGGAPPHVHPRRAASMPGAELGLRMWELATATETPIVVHCAGRTRSIIGAGTLLRMGARNVFALKNGTSGWRLSGFELETGSDRIELPEPTPEHRREAEETARRVALDDGVRFARAWELDGAQGTGEPPERLPARRPQPRTSTPPATSPASAGRPAASSCRRTDSYIGVVNSLVVLACDGITRAAMTGSWLRQMGFPEVVVIEGGTSAWSAVGGRLETGMAPETPAA